MPRIEASELFPGRLYPVLLVTFHSTEGTTLTVLAIVDSGADESVLPSEPFEAAGIRWEDLTPSEQGWGAGGPFQTRIIEGTLQYRKWDIRSPVKLAERGAMPIGLLGRDDFFKRFLVRFDWHAKPPWFQVDPIATPAKKPGARRRKR